MKVIGITGGIATGKTTVKVELQNRGYKVLCSDEIVHEILQKKSVIQKIVKQFGQVTLPDGAIDRKALGEIVFNSTSKLEQLNKIVHPEVFLEIDRILLKEKKLETKIVFIDMPLLFETAPISMFSSVIVVYTSAKQQLTRLINRNNLTKEAAYKRIKSQMSLTKKISRADFVVDNTKEISSLKKQIDNILKIV